MTISVSSDWLTNKLLDFIATLHKCYVDTTYAQDRTIYANDIAMAIGWIVDIRNGHKSEVVIGKILSSETAKYFGDYWRQGEWGELELKALKALKDELNTKASPWLPIN